MLTTEVAFAFGWFVSGDLIKVVSELEKAGFALGEVGWEDDLCVELPLDGAFVVAEVAVVVMAFVCLSGVMEGKSVARTLRLWPQQTRLWRYLAAASLASTSAIRASSAGSIALGSRLRD